MIPPTASHRARSDARTGDWSTLAVTAVRRCRPRKRCRSAYTPVTRRPFACLLACLRACLLPFRRARLHPHTRPLIYARHTRAYGYLEISTLHTPSQPSFPYTLAAFPALRGNLFPPPSPRPAAPRASPCTGETSEGCVWRARTGRPHFRGWRDRSAFTFFLLHISASGQHGWRW